VAKIVSNRLLAISLLMLCLYWLAGSIVPHPYLTILNNIFLFTVSSIGLWRYRETVSDILFRGERVHDAERGYGGYLAVYGIFLVFLGSFYGAIYSSIWIWNGEPKLWMGTSFAQFGRFLTVCGFGCMAFSPDITKEGFILPDRLWAIVFGMLLLFAAGIWVGTRVDSTELRLSAAPSCRDGEIIGTGKKTYHMPDSRYRYIVVPRKCFGSEDEAKKSGYRGVK